MNGIRRRSPTQPFSPQAMCVLKRVSTAPGCCTAACGLRQRGNCK